MVVEVDDEGWASVKGTDPDLPPDPEPIHPEPPGFPRQDQYGSHDEACMDLVKTRVPKDKPAWRRAILDWCEHRSFHASRNTIVKSRVDGSQIHDRDRPTAWIFYERGVTGGWLDPDNCPFHRINRKLKHPPRCHRLRRNWPFKDTRLTDKMSWKWLHHPHDMERFGARGPHDWNANAFKHIPGCWDPAQLDRFDVGITVTVIASLKICEKHGCFTKRDIKRYW